MASIKNDVARHILEYAISMVQRNSDKCQIPKGTLLGTILRPAIPTVADKDINEAFAYLVDEKLCTITSKIGQQFPSEVIIIEPTLWGIKTYYEDYKGLKS